MRKGVTKYRGLLIVIKDSIHEKGVIILELYVPKKLASKYIKQNVFCSILRKTQVGVLYIWEMFLKLRYDSYTIKLIL